MLHPITDETGEVIDEYDDEQFDGPTESDERVPREPASHAPIPSCEPGNAGLSAGSGRVETLPQHVLPEDTTDFERSDVKIEILLHRSTGDTRGRRVSVLIHNFAASPMAQDFHEADLTENARLDHLERAIYPVVQRFLLELAARKQKKLAEEAKRVSRPVPVSRKAPPVLQGVPPARTPTPTPTPTPPPSLASLSPTRTATTSLVGNERVAKKKENAAGKTGTYQSIPLF